MNSYLELCQFNSLLVLLPQRSEQTLGLLIIFRSKDEGGEVFFFELDLLVELFRGLAFFKEAHYYK